jgi:hypothetical protein
VKVAFAGILPGNELLTPISKLRLPGVDAINKVNESPVLSNLK